MQNKFLRATLLRSLLIGGMSCLSSLQCNAAGVFYDDDYPATNITWQRAVRCPMKGCDEMLTSSQDLAAHMDTSHLSECVIIRGRMAQYEASSAAKTCVGLVAKAGGWGIVAQQGFKYLTGWVIGVVH